jgi:hypothetical protein
MVGAKRQPWDQIIKKRDLTLKGLGMCAANPFRVDMGIYWTDPGLSLRANRWAKISQHLRRI